MTAALRREGLVINHKRVERLMRVMGLEAIYPKKRVKSMENADIRYPYLLSDLTIDRPNHVWGTDITYIRLKSGFIYCVALIDWYARYILSWKLSTTMHVDFCISALQEALQIAQPEIHNSDQGSQFTSAQYIAALQQYPTINISMDGRGRCFDNIFTERFWRTLKYEEIYINDYQSFDDAQQSIAQYMDIYNNERLHQSLNYRTPAEVYFQSPHSFI
jgi:putative transposase